MLATYAYRRLGVTVTVAALLAGCAATQEPWSWKPQPEAPPTLRVRGLEPPSVLTGDPKPYSVEIKNGAGDVLYSGGDLGRIERDVPLWKLDGTLVITTLWTNRETTTQTLVTPAGKPVDVVYDALQQLPQRRYVLVALAEPPPGAAAPGASRPAAPAAPPVAKPLDYAALFEIHAGYGKFSDKAPTYGVTLGADTALNKAPSKIDFWNVGLDMYWKQKFAEWQPKMELNANWGSKSTTTADSVGSRGQAFAGGAHGGTNGFASNAPSVSDIKTKYNAQSIVFAGESPLGVFNQSEYSRISKEIFVEGERISRKYNSALYYPALPGLAGIDDQKVTNWGIGVGLGAFGTHYFDNGFTFSAGGRLGANWVSGDYSGTHRYTNPQAAPINQDFTQATDDDRSAFTWSGKVFGALGYRPNRDSEWSVGLQFDYLGNAFALQNKVTPGDPTPRLDNHSVQALKAEVRFRARF